MTAMAEVIDESIRNITSNMVTKSEQEKVCIFVSRKDVETGTDAGDSFFASSLFICW